MNQRDRKHMNMMDDFQHGALKDLYAARLMGAKVIMYHTITVAIVAGVAAAIFALLHFVN